MKNIKKILLFLGFFLLSVLAWTKYDPGIEWHEREDAHFIVVFPKEYSLLAADILDKAESHYTRLSNFWQQKVQGKIRLLLVTDTDYGNGSATFFPYNIIEICYSEPSPESILAGRDDNWIDTVLAHEITHLLIFNKGSGFFRFFRKIFGSFPAFYPLSQHSVVLLEGLAIYGESIGRTSGRLNTPDFRNMMQALAQGKRFKSYLAIRGNPTVWPQNMSKYLYGALFYGFLADQFGSHGLVRLVRHLGRVPLSLSISTRLKTVFGKGIRQLWKEFGASYAANKKAMGALWQVTDTGKIKGFPLALSENSVCFIENNRSSMPGIKRFDLKTGKRTRLVSRKNIETMSFCSESGSVYFSAVDFHRHFRLYSDLYRIRADNGEVEKLTRGKRLSWPQIFPGKNRLLCVKKVDSRAHLAYLCLDTLQEQVVSRGFQGLAFPAVSPAGDVIAASVKLVDRNWRIGMFTPRGKLMYTLELANAKIYSPVWRNQFSFFFIAEYLGHYRLAEYDLKTGQARVFADQNIPEIKFFSFMGGSNKLMVIFLSHKGYDLATVNPDKLTFFPLKLKIKKKITAQEPLSVAAPETHKYRWFRDILPKYFSLIPQVVEKEIIPGIRLSGRDLTGERLFSFWAGWGLKTRQLNYRFNIHYNGFFPDLNLAVSQEYGLFRREWTGDYLHVDRSVVLSSVWPLITDNQRKLSVYGDIHFRRIRDEGLTRFSSDPVLLNGLRLSLLYRDYQKYYDSISRSDGIKLELSYSRELKIMGSDTAVNTVFFESRSYMSVHKANVFAMRLAGAHSWGEARRLFYLGGTGALQNSGRPGNKAFTLMRGIPAGFLVGHGGWAANFELRLGFKKIERAFTVGPSFERIYFTLFGDVGDLWADTIELKPLFTWGLEANLVLYVGAPVTLSLGIAAGGNSSITPAIYFRIGESF